MVRPTRDAGTVSYRDGARVNGKINSSGIEIRVGDLMVSIKADALLGARSGPEIVEDRTRDASGVTRAAPGWATSLRMGGRGNRPGLVPTTGSAAERRSASPRSRVGG